MLAAYVRVSTKAQDLDMQRDAIARICKTRGERVGVWFSEKTSGAGPRPELVRLREQVRQGKIQKLYVYRLDRLSRSGILEVLNIVSELREHGCQLESVADGFALQGPMGDIVLAVFAWVAEMERDAIRRRMHAARVRLERTGGRWGRPRKVGASDVQRMKALQAEGRTVRAIAIALKIPRSTVSEYLSGKPTTKRTLAPHAKPGLHKSDK